MGQSDDMTLETSEEWVAYAREHEERLMLFLRDYHPATQKRRYVGPITALGAEQACEIVRKSIAKEEAGSDPVKIFKKALEGKDIGTVASLLNGAWFGVPESTECWRVPGFSEAVTLIEESPWVNWNVS